MQLQIVLIAALVLSFIVAIMLPGWLAGRKLRKNRDQEIRRREGVKKAISSRPPPAMARDRTRAHV